MMKKYIRTWYLLPALLVVLASTPVRAEDAIVEDQDGDPDAKTISVTLVWDRNPETDIAGYNVYYGRNSGDYLRLVTVTRPTAMIAVKGSKTTYFAVTAYNTNGVESALSEEVHWP
jgi:fibronectin type 3 domain-containing protein